METSKLQIDNRLLDKGELAHPGHAQNQKWWNEVTPVHAASKFYNVEGFLAGKVALDRLELDWLGDVAGKRVLHLQCHFGLSTIELARRGAAEVVGVDFSPVAIQTARDLAEKSGFSDRVSFVESDVLLLDQIHDRRYDLIFTSYGVITWLSNLQKWGKVIATFLAPSGRFVIVEIHPSALMFEDVEGRIERKFSYFHCENGIHLPPSPDYADNSYITQNATHEWQWSLADVFRALTRAGLRVSQFEEYPTCCFKPFSNMVESGPDLYRLPDGEMEIPMTFAMEATF